MHTSAKTLSASSQKSSDGAIRQLLGVDRIRDPKRRSASSGERLISTLLPTCAECSTFARSYPSPRATLRPLSIYTMLLLAYCAGLRRGELARLDIGDVNSDDGTITVRQTKFFKTRILPLPDSVMTELRAYIAARRRVGASQDPHSALFWHVQRRSRYTPEKAVSRSCRSTSFFLA